MMPAWKHKALILVVPVLMAASASALAQEVPYTLEDRERLIRVETKLEEMGKRFEQRFDQIDKHLEQVDKRFEQIDKRFEQVDRRFEQVDKRFAQVDRRFEQVDKRFAQMHSLFLGIIGAFAGIVAVTIGFAIWDRRTALTPALRRSQNLEERQDRLERALRELAQGNAQIAEVLRRTGLL